MSASDDKGNSTLYPKFIVVADDLTGANDTGVQLKKHGLSTITIIDKDYIEDVCGYDAVVIDSETRSMTEKESLDKTLQISNAIKRFAGRSTIYKKVDSTLRGYIGSELKVLVDILNPDMVVFAPAYPDNKRTTIEGVHYVNNVPLDKTEFCNDPKNPVMTGNIQKLLKQNADIDSIHINTNDIREGKIQEIARNSHTKYFSFDAEKNSDLSLIIREISSLNKVVLWAGSAGLANMLVSYMYEKDDKVKPAIAVVGSINSMSLAQVKKALERKNIIGIKINKEDAILNPEQEKRRLVEEAVSAAMSKSDIILAAAFDKSDIIDASYLEGKLSLTTDAISDRIAQFIGEAIHEILKLVEISGMFLTGGDTAIKVTNRLSAKGSVILEEVETGIPYIKLFGGPFEGLNIITKAGAFGNENTIINSLEYLKNKCRA